MSISEKIKRVVAGLVAVAALVGVNFDMVEVEQFTEYLVTGVAAVLGAYAIARNWLAKFL